ERYQGAGAVLYAGLLGVAFQSPVRRWAAKPALVQTVRSRVASLNRPTRVLLALAVVLTALFVWRWELTVPGEFRIGPRHNADVRAEVEGIIAGIHVDEGQRIAAGDVVATLTDRDYQAELQKVGAEIAERRARLKVP